MAGQPRKFPTPQDLEKKWDKYVEYCEKPQLVKANDRVVPFYKLVSKTGFLKYAKLNRNFYDDYKKLKDFSDILEKIQQDCKTYLLEMGLKGIYNSNIVKLIASANYGMSEKRVLLGDKDNPLEVNITMNSLLDEDLQDER